MKLLWHCTPDRNLLSIAQRGLLVEFATGRLRAVWLHCFSERERICRFIADRYQLERFQLSLVGVKISRRRLRRFGRGIWYALTDVDPLHLVLPFDQEAEVRLYRDCPW